MAVISTSFCMRKNRTRANGKSPIYMRIKLDPDYFDVQTKVFAHAQLWDGARGG
jgi:Arm DNA-binding domain